MKLKQSALPSGGATNYISTTNSNLASHRDTRHRHDSMAGLLEQPSKDTNMALFSHGDLQLDQQLKVKSTKSPEGM